MTVRAYVPSTLPEVLRWYDAGEVPTGTVINAVTTALRTQNPGADDEELEFLATRAADEISTISAVTTGHRRATVAIDVDPADTEPNPGGVTSVRLTEPVGVGRWAALFVDDMLWYDVAEIPHLR